MKTRLILLGLSIHLLGLRLHTGLQGRITELKAQDPERGSLTLEQILWTVGIAVVAIATLAIIVGAINSKAAELPL